MKYPELVPDWVCKTPITLKIEGEGIDADGAPESVTEIMTKCNFQDGGKIAYTPDLKEVKISGRAYFNGDIAPQLTNIVGGEATIFGETREILQGFKRRNPDGSVNHTEVLFK